MIAPTLPLPDREDILADAEAWLAAGDPVALATVVETWGSGPRPPGSRMAIAASGRIAGSVSGGCVEAAIIEAAHDCIATLRPRALTFGVTDDRAWEVGLPCGGQLTVWLEPIA